eukprot:Protomagalhaensia_wolfi_Nauph_80__4100@NODE_415_length_2562_cov_6_734047_g311_i0_p3_GENE_NODE_415_length_2562_cov_6_734047_g311_i0NODE_415_length_2562_cov_6_734047_g311_i0_p3_ORF_typecomplete_len140_score4_09_NODE_415_length_2562_cov_6_734047_g311_i011511570
MSQSHNIRPYYLIVRARNEFERRESPLRNMLRVFNIYHIDGFKGLIHNQHLVRPPLLVCLLTISLLRHSPRQKEPLAMNSTPVHSLVDQIAGKLTSQSPTEETKLLLEKDGWRSTLLSQRLVLAGPVNSLDAFALMRVL